MGALLALVQGREVRVSQAASSALPSPALSVLVLASALGPIAMNMFIPSMPGLAREFGEEFTLVQLSLTLYLTTLAIMQPVYGYLSDRIGRRKVLIAAALTFNLGCLLCFLSQDIVTLVSGRVMQAAGGAAGLALSRAIARDVYSDEGTASILGYLTMVGAIGQTLSPVVGGLFDTYSGWRPIFILLLILGCISMVGAALFLPETRASAPTKARKEQSLRELVVLLFSIRFIKYTIIISLSSGAYFAFIAGAPYITIKTFHLSATAYGFYFLLGAAGYIYGNFVSGKYTMQLGSIRLIVLGAATLLVSALAFVAILLIGWLHPLSMFGFMAAVAFANGLILPGSTAAAVGVNRELSGVASGLIGLLQLIAGAVVTYLIGVIYEASAWPMTIAVLCCAVGTAGSLLVFRQPE